MRTLLFVTSLSIALMGCGGNGGVKPNASSSSSDKSSTSSSPVSSSTTSSSATSSSLFSSSSSNSSASMQATELTRKIDTYLANNQPADQPGISVLIVKDGKVAYSGGRGMADIPAGVAIASNTGFRLASVSKSFTAIAIMQLVEKGDIKLTDHLLDYIPELPATWAAITIEQLLTHSSGIYDIINDQWNATIMNGMGNSDLVDYFTEHPALEFTPGARHEYSNTGYMFLANIIEKKTGLSFPDYMQQYLFGPANMSGSYINDENQAIKQGDALNYAKLRTYYGVTTNFKGSMAQVSSRDDFLHFFEAMRNHRLISAQTQAEMFRSHGVLAGPNVNYGYGFAIFGDLVTHGGDWDGFQTEMTFVNDRDIQFVILANAGTKAHPHMNAIRDIIFNTAF